MNETLTLNESIVARVFDIVTRPVYKRQVNGMLTLDESIVALAPEYFARSVCKRQVIE